MFKHINNVNLMNYGLYLQSTSINSDSVNTTLTFELSIPSGAMNLEDTESNIDRFFLDLKMLNELRGSQTTAVRNHYEELLTLLALSKSPELGKKDK